MQERSEEAVEWGDVMLCHRVAFGEIMEVLKERKREVWQELTSSITFGSWFVAEAKIYVAGIRLRASSFRDSKLQARRSHVRHHFCERQ